jgi:radical SAM superfamily enzyme YgiQ (UPF0313 family)
MKVVDIIIPPVVTHNLDPHTGIPFLPHMAAYLASSIKKTGRDVNVIDCFGEDSQKSFKSSNFLLIGIKPETLMQKLSRNSDICFIYCKVIEDLFAVELILNKIKKNFPNKKVCLFENIQTTNSFSLKKIINYLFDKGCDFAIFGEPEDKIQEFLDNYQDNKLSEIPGIAYKKNNELVVNDNEVYNTKLDNIDFPLWEKFNMNGYWTAGYSHAPVKKNKKFLPIITSRGCPYRCKFCVSPTLNPKWRFRSAKNVVDEMEFFNKSLNIVDFHVSDLDPTVNEKRIIEICSLIIERGLKIEWKLSQGTKVETIKNMNTLDLMKKSGLNFFSFSPESGSIELMKKLNKPFDYKHGLNVTKHLNKIKVSTQACFIAGTPPETDDDRKQTINYMKKLAKFGIDEIAVFIYSPIPGSFFSDEIGGFKHYSELSRSPIWRDDYKVISKFRYKMYLTFFLYKLFYHPIKLINNLLRVFTRNFQTKMEMSVFKYFKLRLMYLFK